MSRIISTRRRLVAGGVRQPAQQPSIRRVLVASALRWSAKRKERSRTSMASFLRNGSELRRRSSSYRGSSAFRRMARAARPARMRLVAFSQAAPRRRGTGRAARGVGAGRARAARLAQQLGFATLRASRGDHPAARRGVRRRRARGDASQAGAGGRRRSYSLAEDLPGANERSRGVLIMYVLSRVYLHASS